MQDAELNGMHDIYLNQLIDLFCSTLFHEKH
ncbi:hypothetical protein Mucpa_1572 [Mucilaginibacter paludis DSM 18603]|uniref:Uncharacterized protein n=1 Tax=Mucilaginibacter paludis DSM 18603 TaxID=714943 RepID=H1Y496_9SPHI|nr:hypothetical protein Mucpa_1572 [Mucilaginibacter paludis DSM 18603]